MANPCKYYIGKKEYTEPLGKENEPFDLPF